MQNDKKQLFESFYKQIEDKANRAWLKVGTMCLEVSVTAYGQPDEIQPYIGVRLTGKASDPISLKEKQTLAQLWDALSDILEDPMASDALSNLQKQRANEAIEEAFKCTVFDPFLIDLKPTDNHGEKE